MSVDKVKKECNKSCVCSESFAYNPGTCTLEGYRARIFYCCGADLARNRKLETMAGLIVLQSVLIELCNLPKRYQMNGLSFVSTLGTLMDDWIDG